MIKVTRLNGTETVINADLIESVEATPDTVISLTTGHKYVVHESVDEVVARVVAYRLACRRCPEQAPEQAADQEER
ncbi:MAG: flagellar FlbD family protein [Armatimonadota bacterium]|nr:flagellar FlbD family protein [Armatimonadota bacterium]MDW8155950.1 flagellar FlbD family protein [Armatimonadota bacterium]